MPPKRKGGSSKTSASKKPKTSDQPPTINESQPVLYIECCRSCTVFKRRAEALHSELNELLIPLKTGLELQLTINSDGPPRRGSFEVSIAAAPSNKAAERTLVWTGLKNTPRAAKFPSAESIAEDIKRYLKMSAEDMTFKETKFNSDKPPNNLDVKDVVVTKENIRSNSRKKSKP